MINSVSIKKIKKQINITSLNKNVFIYEFKIIKSIIHSLRKKKIIVSESKISFLYKKLYLNLKIFTEYVRVKFYKKKYKEKKFRYTRKLKKKLKKQNYIKKNKKIKKKKIKKKKFKVKTLIEKKPKKKKLKRIKIKNKKRKKKKLKKFKRKKFKNKKAKIKKIKIKKFLFKKNILKKNNFKFIIKHWNLTKLFQKSVSSTKKQKYSNNLVISITNLNLYVDSWIFKQVQDHLKRKPYYKFFHINYKRYKDFLKITSLFIDNNFSLKAYLNVLGRVFRTVSKKRHKAFFYFLEKLAYVCTVMTHKRYLEYIKVPQINDKRKVIFGINFIISGRIRGKRRSSIHKIVQSNISFNSYKKYTCMQKVPVFTRYGTFGFKMIVTYRNYLKKSQKYLYTYLLKKNLKNSIFNKYKPKRKKYEFNKYKPKLKKYGIYSKKNKI